jgi:hypothetical protein
VFRLAVQVVQGIRMVALLGRTKSGGMVGTVCGGGVRQRQRGRLRIGVQARC